MNKQEQVEFDQLMAEVRRYRAIKKKKAAVARENGKAGGRPRMPDSKVLPASLDRRKKREQERKKRK